MPMPGGIGIVDLMLGFPIADYDKTYDFLRKAARDKESKESMRFPVEYMFKGVPYDFGKGQDPIEVTLREMDKWGVERAMIGIAGDTSQRALAEHPERFVPCLHVDPNQGMDAVRQMADAVARWFPSGCAFSLPQGGFLLWVELPRGVDSVAVFKAAKAARVGAAPGAVFSTTRRYDHCIRLQCGDPWSSAIEAGVRTLGTIIDRQLQRSG